MYTANTKFKWMLCLDLGSIPKTVHHVLQIIQNLKKSIVGNSNDAKLFWTKDIQRIKLNINQDRFSSSVWEESNPARPTLGPGLWLTQNVPHWWPQESRRREVFWEVISCSYESSASSTTHRLALTGCHRAAGKAVAISSFNIESLDKQLKTSAQHLKQLKENIK